MTASALFAPSHISLISLTRDDSVRPEVVPRSRREEGESILGRVAQGDPHAMRECIDRFGGLIWTIARRATPSHADAKDAVQDIFADVWRSAGRFSPSQGSEKVFIVTIARRRLIDRMRRAAARGRTESVDDIDALGWPDSGNSPEMCAEAVTARQAVMRLRPELRQVLELGILQGLTHAEIADELQLPLGTVKTRMRRGLIQVREWMAK